MKKEPLSIIAVKILLAVIIFVGVGTIIIGGGWLIGNYGKVSEPVKLSQKQSVEIVEEEIKDETADWKTYRNEEYGFEIKYPNNYKVGPRKNLIELEPDDYNKYCLITIGQHSSFKNVLFTDWHQKNMAGNQDLLIKEENKNQMLKTVEADGIQTLTNYTYFTNEKTAVYLSCNKDKDNSIYDQILSTFRFIEN